MGNALCCSQERRGLEELENIQNNQNGMNKSTGSDRDELSISRSRAMSMKAQVERQKWIRKGSGYRWEETVDQRDTLYQNQGQHADSRRGFHMVQSVSAESLDRGAGGNGEVVIKHTRQNQHDRRIFQQNYNPGRNITRNLPSDQEQNIVGSSDLQQGQISGGNGMTKTVQHTAYDLRCNQIHDVSYELYNGSDPLNSSVASNAADKYPVKPPSYTYLDFSKEDTIDHKLSFDDSKLQSLPISF